VAAFEVTGPATHRSQPTTAQIRVEIRADTRVTYWGSRSSDKVDFVHELDVVSRFLADGGFRVAVIGGVALTATDIRA
jgi:hypothetical protein